MAPLFAARCIALRIWPSSELALTRDATSPAYLAPGEFLRIVHQPANGALGKTGELRGHLAGALNNGLTKDDQPDLELVTRASRMPDRTTCTPVACVAGKVTASCRTDRDCDSAAGANDGDCDACPIVGGLTTENEMFVLNPWYVLPPKK